ncbi:MAG: AsmA family protein [Desulfovibrionaceae bacterium]|nr:AsmA family protein [Desulfovibrionaceae bacterium]
MRKARLDIVLLIVWGLLLSAGVALYLSCLQPARLGRTVSDTLESLLGVRCAIRQVDFSVIPRAQVTLREIRLEPDAAPGVKLRADACRAELSWLSLFRLRPVLHRVELEGAVADIIWPLPDLRSPVERDEEARRTDGEEPGIRQAETGRPWAMPALPALLTGVRLRVVNSSLRLHSGDNSRELVLSGISGRGRLPGLFRGSVDLSVRKSVFRGEAVPEITLDKFRLEAHSLREDERGELLGSLSMSGEVQMAALDAVIGHSIAPPYRYFPMPSPARLEFSAGMALAPESRRSVLAGDVKLDAVLPMNGHDTPLRVRLPYRLDSLDRIRVEGMDIDFDGDRAVLSGDITGLREAAPVFAGQAVLGHFSLSRWFGFGHRMSAGLQHALNDISGTLDFVLTPQGVRVPRLEARLQSVDALLVGSGGCEKFLEPDIVINGHMAGAVDLNPLFPELGGAAPDMPDLPPPVVGLDEDGGGGEPSIVGYAIHLTADKAALWRLEADQADCLISPAPLSDKDRAREAQEREAAIRAGKSPPAPWKSAGHGPQLTVSLGGFYGGTADAVVNLDDVFRVRATLKGVAAQEALSRIAGCATPDMPLAGTLDGKADLNFSGSSAAAVVSSLAGTADATLKNGFMTVPSGTRLPYRALNIKARAKAVPGGKSGTTMPEVMPFSGNWQVSLDTDAWAVSADSGAAMTFSMANGLPLSMAPQPASLRVRLGKNTMGSGAWPADLNFNLAGRLSFDLDAGTLTLADLSGGRPGLDLGGSIQVSSLFGSPVTQGRVSIHSGTLREAAADFGLSLPASADPAAFSALELETDMRYSEQGLDLKNMIGRLDRTSLAGNIRSSFGQRPFWNISLHLGELDTDRYLPAPSTAPGGPTPVRTDFLRGYDADIRLNVDHWTLFSTPILHFSLPLTLRKGVLDSGVFSGSFPGGGTLNGTVHGDATAGQARGTDQLGLRLQVRLKDVDMLPLSKARSQDTLLAGTGTAQCDVQADLRTWSDIPARLDGTLSFAVRDGYLMSARAAAEQERARDERRPTGLGMSPPSANPVQANRTIFQTLAASASIVNGILTSSDFRMESPILSVRGGGSVDLNSRIIAAKATAELIGVPHIPVEISGSLDDPQTSYSVAEALAGTIGNIGGTVVDIVSGVLTTPFRLLMGKKTIQ